jgi:putative transposase
LYFLGLSYRNAAKALSSRIKKRRSHVAVWKWVQKYKPERIFTKRKRIFEFIIDETQLKVGNNYFWIWIAIESSDRTVLVVRISAKRNISASISLFIRTILTLSVILQMYKQSMGFIL